MDSTSLMGLSWMYVGAHSSSGLLSSRPIFPLTPLACVCVCLRACEDGHGRRSGYKRLVSWEDFNATQRAAWFLCPNHSYSQGAWFEFDMSGMSIEETSKQLKVPPGSFVGIIGFFQIMRIPDIVCLSGMYENTVTPTPLRNQKITAASVSSASLHLSFTLLCSLLAFIALLLSNLPFQKVCK